MRRLCATWIALAITTLAAGAAADAAPDKEACVASFDRGQRAQSDRALRRALNELIVCSQESCPNVLRADCAGVLAEVRTALPTIVFAADDGNGHELTDVRVYAGKELVAETLDGRAIPFDPGTFELRFERAGQPPLATTRTIREGEKSRVIRVSMNAGGAVDTPGPSGTTPKRNTLGWVLPGSLAVVGLAGVGISIYARLHFDSRVDELRGSCAPDCTPEQRDQLSTNVVTSNVALVAGIGTLALAVGAWFLTGPSASPRSAANSLGTWTW